jgi:hypothetical protein
MSLSGDNGEHCKQIAVGKECIYVNPCLNATHQYPASSKYPTAVIGSPADAPVARTAPSQ